MRISPPFPSLDPRSLALVLLLLAVGWMGCGSSGGARSGVTSNQITINELDMDVAGYSAHEIVQQLRPQWLEKRGENSFSSPNEISVYLDTNNTRFGPASSLSQLRAINIEAIEFLNSQQAQFRFGLDNTQGVILVHMKQGN